MSAALDALLLLAALLGHCVLWVGFVNRIHGVGIVRWLVDWLTWTSVAIFLSVPALTLVLLVMGRPSPTPFLSSQMASDPLAWYTTACVVLLAASAAMRVCLALHPERRGVLKSETREVMDLWESIGDQLLTASASQTLARVPGNQAFAPELTKKELLLPGLPAALAGLRVAHLSDLHMCGRVGIDYFKAVVDRTLAEDADLVVLSGDLVEFDEQLDWVDDTLLRLTAPHGVFFVRGNHEQRLDSERLRERLSAGGLIDLGGSHREIEVRGCRVRLVGNELPWYPPAGDPAGDGAPVDFSIAVVHGPDQFRWAERHEFDLVLAGHNHGGQIRLPGLGAIVTPSLHGTRYNSGVFRRGRTVMHVSRGVGSLAPLRLNCRPEFSVLTLRGAP